MNYAQSGSNHYIGNNVYIHSNKRLQRIPRSLASAEMENMVFFLNIFTTNIFFG